MSRTRRPAAHNPVVFRKTALRPGRHCDAPGCAGFVLATENECSVCAFNEALAALERDANLDACTEIPEAADIDTKTCSRCNGTGWWATARVCFKCGGEG